MLIVVVVLETTEIILPCYHSIHPSLTTKLHKPSSKKILVIITEAQDFVVYFHFPMKSVPTKVVMHAAQENY